MAQVADPALASSAASAAKASVTVSAASTHWEHAQAFWVSPGTGNAATFLGVLATLLVAWLSLRFSQNESRLRAEGERRIATLAAAQIGSMLDLAADHLRRFGLAILFASWDSFADNEEMAKDMFSRLEPIGLEVAIRLAPLGDDLGLKMVRGFARVAEARRLLEDSLPSGGVNGVLLRMPWTEERDVQFKALLASALDDLEASAAMCNAAVTAALAKGTASK